MNTRIIKKLRNIVGARRIVTDPSELLVYESDGLPIEKRLPGAVVFPESTAEIVEIVKLLSGAGIPFVPRGAGTGLSGGCLPPEGGVVISITRMNRILEVNPADRYAVVEPGVLNQEISDRVRQYGLHYAPDPASGMSCTIGGNIAENSGGPHTLKYGVTVNHVLGMEMVLPDGEIVTIGSTTLDTPGYDLPGVIIGSEGTFVIVTKAVVKLIQLPESYATFYAEYGEVDDATRSISGILHAGIIPAALEMIDGEFIKALKDVFQLDFNSDAKAVLIIELDGPSAGMDILKKRVVDICGQYNVQKIEAAATAEQRTQLWKARKLAFGAIGRLSPCYLTQDGVVPRTKLPEILNIIHSVAAKYNVRIANAFHAGDGNLHPLLMYDERIPGELEKAKKASNEIIRSCVDLGGTISGEHGIGIEKRDFMTLIFNKYDLAAMSAVKEVFNPRGLLNPGKVFPHHDSRIQEDALVS
ncbi:FAD-binding oxidoreductase [candidate division KSB1 bacterium]